MKLEEIKRLNRKRTQGKWEIRECCKLDQNTYRNSQLNMTIRRIDHGTNMVIAPEHFDSASEFDSLFVQAAPSMAGILTKLADFEVTETWAEKVMLSLLSKEDREKIIKDGGFSSYIKAKWKAEYQAVIDQLKEELGDD